LAIAEEAASSETGALHSQDPELAEWAHPFATPIATLHPGRHLSVEPRS